MSQFSNVDRNIPQQVHIYWTMITERDDTAGKPDEMQDGYWPSHDPDDAGYVPAEQFDDAHDIAQQRMNGWLNDVWEYIGVMAKATVYIPIGGTSFRVMELQSSGIWGIESDSESYIEETYEEQKRDLLTELLTLGAALANNGVIHKD
jgi:hypothetical protein